jgi:hypothetical protein
MPADEPPEEFTVMSISALSSSPPPVTAQAAPPPKPPAKDNDGDGDHGAPDVTPPPGSPGSTVNIKA